MATPYRGAINARPAVTVEYGPDPRGWGFFRRLSGVLHRGITGRDGTRVIDPHPAFHGVAPTRQSMSGMAPLGGAAPVVKASSQLTDERAAGALEDGHLRIFAERLRRGL